MDLTFRSQTLTCESPRRYLHEVNVTSCHAPLWDESRSPIEIVVILTDRIGDTLNAIYFLANLRSTWPEARLHFVGRRFGDPAFLRHCIGPYVDELHLADRWSDQDVLALDADVVFDLNPARALSPRLDCRRAAVTIGHHEWCDVFVEQRVDNWKANDHLNLLRLFGKRVAHDYPPLSIAASMERGRGPMPARPYVVLCLEATATAWMLTDAVMDGLVRFLLQSTDEDICVLGGNINRSGYRPSIASDRLHDLTGRLPLFQSLLVLVHANYVVAVDTGLMHAASYLGRPLLALFTCGNPARSGPQGQRGRVVVQRVRVEPPTGVSAKKDHKQSGRERSYLRLDHIVEGLGLLHETTETSVRDRIAASTDVAMAACP